MEMLIAGVLAGFAFGMTAAAVFNAVSSANAAGELRLHYRILQHLGVPLMKTYKIEIRAHFAEPEKVKMIEDACREAARTVLATAILLSEKSKPEAKFMTEDFIEGITEHDITADD